MTTCNCYVQGLPDYERNSSRSGVHTLSCPAWSLVGDHHEWAADQHTRARYLRAACTHPDHVDSSDCLERAVGCHVDCVCCIGVHTFDNNKVFVAEDGYADGGEAYEEDELRLLNAWQ